MNEPYGSFNAVNQITMLGYTMFIDNNADAVMWDIAVIVLDRPVRSKIRAPLPPRAVAPPMPLPRNRCRYLCTAGTHRIATTADRSTSFSGRLGTNTPNRGEPGWRALARCWRRHVVVVAIATGRQSPSATLHLTQTMRLPQRPAASAACSTVQATQVNGG